MTLLLSNPTPLGAGRGAAATADLREMGGRLVAFADIDGRRHDGTGAEEAEVVERALSMAEANGCPGVVRIKSVAVDISAAGIAGLDAWGRVARRAVRLSGLVPLVVIVTGPVHGALGMIMGLADFVVMTDEATVYVNGPGPVKTITGVNVDAVTLGGASSHASKSGVASFLAVDETDAMEITEDLLAMVPDNLMAQPPMASSRDPLQRSSDLAARAVPTSSQYAYDVRDVIEDVFDSGTMLEVQAEFAPNIVCAFARMGGAAVAIVANQPKVRAGTLDIDASCKAARHVQFADAFGLPIVTFVDTPGYEPGRDLEWRGMIRHGAKLVSAYGEATVPRIGVVLRKAYGGAYIVMDSRSMGNDVTFAWPSAEIAVMGAPGAIAILNRREIETASDPDALRLALEEKYRANFCTPELATQRGYVDEVIDPLDTRRSIAGALRRLANKRADLPSRAHTNGPL